MTLFLVVLIALAVVAGAATVLTVFRDGYRRTPTTPCAGPRLDPNQKWNAA